MSDALRYARLFNVAVLATLLVAGCQKQPPSRASSATDKGAGSPPSAAAATAPSDADRAALQSFLKREPPQGAAEKAMAAGRSAAAGPAPANPHLTQPGTRLKFDAAPDWKLQPSRSSMRQAQYALPHAEGDSEDGELVLYYFGADQGGSVSANLDRWRSQFTTPDGNPLPADAGVTEKFEVNGLAVTLLDIEGRYAPGAMPGMPPQEPKDGFRMLAVVVETPLGPWFFKATGPAATMARHRDAIRKMLDTCRL
jgi:hypothetical protein